MTAHPLQAEVWRTLDRVYCRKEWAFHLRVAESEISRWAGGSRAMSLDDLAACGRLCDSRGHASAAAEVRRALLDALGDAPPAQEAMGALHRVLPEAGDVIRCVADVMDPSGPGGFLVTSEEAEKALAELGELRAAVDAAMSAMRAVGGLRAVGSGR